MNTTRSSFFYRFIPSVTDLVIVAFFLIWVLFDFYVSNFDIWWHLRTGDLILSGVFPKTEIFSFTAAGRPWILHSWGSEVLFSVIYNTFGAPGLVVLRALVVSLIFGILFKLLLRLNINVLLALLLVIIAAQASKFHIIIRPNLFSLLFFVLTFYIYNEHAMHGRRNILYFLPVLFVVWINLHGGFIVGFMLLGLFIAGETIDNLMTRKNFFSADQKKTNVLFLLCILSFILCLFNPNTYKALLYPFLYRGQEAMPLNSIAEWASVSWAKEPMFFLLILFLIAVISLSKSTLRMSQLIPILFFTFYTFKHRRIVPFFTIVTLSFIGPYVQNLITEFYKEAAARSGTSIRGGLNNLSSYLSSRFVYFENMERARNHHVALIGVLLILSSVLVSGRISSLIPLGVSWNMFPTKNIEVMKKLRIKGNIFNEYMWGGILIKEFPEKKVFIDGRIDVYGPDIYSEYLTVKNLKTGWKQILSKYNITHMLVGKKSFISSYLTKTDKNWKLVSEDKKSRLFIKKSRKKVH